MKRLILLLVISLGMFSCYKEDPIVAERGEPRFNLEDDPSDPVQHYIYEFYKNYKTIIITNPDTYDYKFNFSMKNRWRIIAPKQDKTMLASGIKFIQENFVSYYTPEFINKYFPYSLILADSIFDAGFGSIAYRNSVSSTNFIAIGNIRKGIENLSEEKKAELRGEINSSFWNSYMGKARGFFEVNAEFYKVSEKFYRSWLAFYDDTTLEEIDFYDMGLISDDPEWREIDPDFGNMIVAPGEELDLQQWLGFIFQKTPEEIRSICDKYPRMKEKYELLCKSMQDCGFDISKLK